MASRPFSITEGHRRGRHVAWTVLALMLVAVAALSAQAARRGWSPPVAAIPAAVAAPPIQPVAPPAQAAAAAELAAPGEGTTGTIALPSLPRMAPAADPAAGPAADPADRSVVAARPFAFGHAPRTDRVRALECLTAAVYYEAASEPDAGQAAVAQVVLNRVRHPAFPASVCGVVYQGSERAGCQFSFACDGAMIRHPPAAAGWARAARAAATALAGHVYAPVGLATHYHTFAVTPAWNRSLVMTDVVGAHFFHRWKGWWGTAAAFRQIYAGGEPLPGPHAPLLAPGAPISGVAPIVALAAPVPMKPTTPLAAVQPVWRGSGVVIAPPAADDHLPPASTILPEWRDSGRPLR